MGVLLQVNPLILLCTWVNVQGFQAVKDVSASQESLIDLFNRIESFFSRLEIYIAVSPTATMTDVLVQIMVEILTLLGIATKEIKRGRMSELICCICIVLNSGFM
jgi:hypothetical protein